MTAVTTAVLALSVVGCSPLTPDATGGIVDYSRDRTLPAQGTLSDLVDVSGDLWSVACPYSTRSELEDAFNNTYEFSFLSESTQLDEGTEILIVVDSATADVAHFTIDRSQATFCIPSWDTTPAAIDTPLTIEDRPDDDGLTIQRDDTK